MRRMIPRKSTDASPEGEPISRFRRLESTFPLCAGRHSTDRCRARRKNATQAELFQQIVSSLDRSPNSAGVPTHAPIRRPSTRSAPPVRDVAARLAPSRIPARSPRDQRSPTEPTNVVGSRPTSIVDGGLEVTRLRGASAAYESPSWRARGGCSGDGRGWPSSRCGGWVPWAIRSENVGQRERVRVDRAIANDSRRRGRVLRRSIHAFDRSSASSQRRTASAVGRARSPYRTASKACVTASRAADPAAGSLGICASRISRGESDGCRRHADDSSRDSAAA
jgi:hypothetical protein